MRRSVAPLVVAWAIATGGAVIAGVRPDQLTAPTPCPEMDVRAMLSHLAAATGQQPRWDDTVVTAALESRQILPAQNRRALFEEISAARGLAEVAIPFAEAVPVRGDAPAIDRLVAPGTAGIPVADPAAAPKYRLDGRSPG